MDKDKNYKRKYFRILKWISIVLLSLCIMFYFLFLGIKSYCGFQRLTKYSINSIIIYKIDINNVDNLRQDSLVLTESQINSFIRKWNHSYPVGLYKYFPSFTVDVKMKNGQIRNFRIGGSNIKENNDFCYRFIWDENFVESTWNKK